jgi:hypothetical protein
MIRIGTILIEPTRVIAIEKNKSGVMEVMLDGGHKLTFSRAENVNAIWQFFGGEQEELTILAESSYESGVKNPF